MGRTRGAWRGKAARLIVSGAFRRAPVTQIGGRGTDAAQADGVGVPIMRDQVLPFNADEQRASLGEGNGIRERMLNRLSDTPDLEVAI